MPDDGSHEHEEAAIARAERLAHALDTAFTLPGTSIRFGWDAIAGLVPVVGDTAALVVGAYPLLEGLRLGVRKRLLAKMGLRLAIDWLLGVVPLLDLVFDVGYKANARNAEDLAAALREGA